MINLPKLIPLIEAAKRMGLPVADLRLSIETGTIATGVFTSPDGEILVSEDIVEPTPIKRDDFSHLIGQPISQSDAARKYAISQVTISGWIKKGIVKKINSDGYRVYADEGDLAYIVSLYKKHGGKQGKHVLRAISSK